MVQRLPKLRGFKRHFKLLNIYQPVNIAALEKDERITAGAIITPELLVSLGLVRKNTQVKVLGNGELTKKLSFSGITAFSETAKEKIEKAGGSIA